MAYKITKGLEKRAIKIFGITNNPKDTGFITKSGKYLNFKTDITPDRFHFRIGQAFKRGTKVGLQTENKYLSETGDIRTQITDENASFEIRKPLTEAQLEAIQKASNNRKIFIDFTDDKGGTIKSAEFNSFPEARSWITRNIK